MLVYNVKRHNIEVKNDNEIKMCAQKAYVILFCSIQKVQFVIQKNPKIVKPFWEVILLKFWFWSPKGLFLSCNVQFWKG